MPDVFEATIVCSGRIFSSRAYSVALRRRLFDDRFDDEIAGRELRQIVVGVADLDCGSACEIHERRRLRFFRALDAAACRRVPIGAAAGNVE